MIEGFDGACRPGVKMRRTDPPAREHSIPCGLFFGKLRVDDATRGELPFCQATQNSVDWD
jgi:hypothetical protein